MFDILISKIYLFAPIFLGASDFNDRHCGSFDEFNTLDVLLHFFLLQDELDLPQKF